MTSDPDVLRILIIVIFVAIFVAGGLVLLAKRRDRGGVREPAAFNGQKVEAEIVEAVVPNQERRCRACETTSPLNGWCRPSTIAAVGGLVAWSRRARGLPPLYRRVRPPFGPEDLCADCSNIRDTIVDKKLSEVNLGVHQVSEQIAREVQKFAVSIDDDLRATITHSDKRRRTLLSANVERKS